MFGRKRLKERVASLESDLEEARTKLAVAVLPVAGMQTRVTVEKDVWYRVSFMYRHTGAPILDLRDVFLGREDPNPVYFDGATVTPE